MNISSPQVRYRNKDNGWNVERVSVENQVIQYQIHQSFYDAYEENTEEFLIHEIKQELYKQLISSDCVLISKHEHLDDMSVTYSGQINVVKNGDQYSGLIETNVFKVEEEKFSEKELIQAVRKTFPERFI
jgi:hypothetical protein